MCHALAVDEEARLEVVERVGHAVEPLPERLVEDRRLAHLALVVAHLGLGLGAGLGLGLG